MAGTPPFLESTALRWAEQNGLPTLKSRMARLRRIMLRGDSTGLGYLGGYPSGNVAAQRNAPFRKMRDFLIASGYDAQDEFVIGSGGYTVASDLPIFDPRVTLGAGWEYWASTTSVFGTIRQSSTMNSPYTFTPDTDCDICTFYFATAIGRGNGEITFGGVTKTFDLNAATGWGSVTVGPADGVALGANICQIVNKTNSIITVDAIHCYDSTRPSYQLLNGSASGMKAQHIANSSDASRSLYFPEKLLSAGDECWWQIGINDWKTSAPTNAAAFQSYVQAWVDRCQLFGIIPKIILPYRSSLSGTSYALMQTYDDIQKAIAKAEGVEVHSLADRLGTYADANAGGYMVGGADYYHPNWSGYLDAGQFYAQLAMKG